MIDDQVLARLRAEKKSSQPTVDFDAVQNRLDQWATRTKKNDGYRTEDVLLLYAEAERLTVELAQAKALLREVADTAHLDEAENGHIAAWFASYRYTVRAYLSKTAALASVEAD